MKPRSNCMPSTTSSVVSVVFASSTVMTPSSPTLSMASAIIVPMSGSLCAEMVATCSFSLRLATGRDSCLSSATARRVPRSSPRLMSMALAPATTLRTPSAKTACASTVAVLVPSPTASEVFLGVLEIELLGDGHAVIADERGTPLLFDQHGFRPWAECHADSVGKLACAAQDLVARLGAEKHLLVGHARISRAKLQTEADGAGRSASRAQNRHGRVQGFEP